MPYEVVPIQTTDDIDKARSVLAQRKKQYPSDEQPTRDTYLFRGNYVVFYQDRVMVVRDKDQLKECLAYLETLDLDEDPRVFEA